MGVTKFASHYMLASDGSFVKWPVVAIDEKGVIKEVYAHPDRFKEEPGVRFFSGLMIPAFVDWQVDEDFFLNNPTKTLNRHFSLGALYLICSRVPDEIEMRKHQIPVVVDCGTSEQKLKMTEHQNHGIPVFNRIMEKNNKSTAAPLNQLLTSATSYAAADAGLSNAGKITPGYTPGLVLIQNLDLINFKLRENSTIKWLNVPEFG